MTALAEKYHNLTEHAEDGCEFGAGLCDCEQVISRVAAADDALWLESQMRIARMRGAVYVNPDSGKAHRLGMHHSSPNGPVATAAICGWSLGTADIGADAAGWCKVCYPEKADAA